MNTSVFTSMLIVFFIVFAMIPNVVAQDYSRLLEKLDQLNKRLDEIQGVENNKIDEIEMSEGDSPEAVSDEAGKKEQVEKTGTSGELVTGTFSGGENPLSSIIEMESMPLEITGFGDVFLSSYQSGETGQSFEIGQVEVDFEAIIADKTIIAAAIAYDNETETFGLGAFTADFHLFDSEGGHLRPVSGIDHSGVIVGQFDVPFGIDWNVYPSIDRKLLSVPLIVENTHGEWNDFGVQLYADNQWFNAVAYGANGFSYETGEVDEFGEPVLADISVAAGGRLGVNLNKYFEVGGSYAGFVNNGSKIDMSLFGLDLQFQHENFSAKGEYVSFSTALDSDASNNSTGFYGQGLYEFERLFLVARYGTFAVDEDGINDINRISIGGGWAISDAGEVRVEHQINSEDGDDTTFLQLVVGF